jgi:hypothetical protein
MAESLQPGEIDLSAYRRRAGQLLDELRKAGVQSDAAELLSRLLPGLQALIEDLSSIGASQVELDPLQKLLATLRERISLGSWLAEGVELWQLTESVLSAFADGKSLPAVEGGVGARRERFWT